MDNGMPNAFNNGKIKSIALGKVPVNTVFRFDRKFYHKYSDHLAYAIKGNSIRQEFLEINAQSYFTLVAVKSGNPF